jgi:bifunctional non-homologous end joining protein LigD
MGLTDYKKKRNFKETPEPTGAKEKVADNLVFVIQRHKASHLHYDFRLELDGVLKSWAVPKGPSLNSNDKRLAMMVEDHPYDYKDFEGIIPEGNYGGGIVEIWDNGTYDAVDEKGPQRVVTDYAKKIKVLQTGLKAGNLKFKLNGKKLKGEFALVKLKGREENSWLLIKHRDEYSVSEPYNSEEHTPKNSPINKWLAEHPKKAKRSSKSKAAEPEALVEEAITPKKAASKKKAETQAEPTLPEERLRKLDDFIPAMLAKESDKAFSDANWIYEIKWDGYRAIAELDNGKVKLYSRNGNSFVYSYPVVFNELKGMDINAVLDGEIVVMDEQGNPSFQKLQHYEENKHLPLLYYVFDLLELNGKQLYDQPLIERKKLLQELLPPSDVIKYSDHVEETGEEFFEVIQDKNLEGIMAKKADSHYYPGKRTSEWLKIKHHKSDEAIICGFTAPRGGRKYFGALVLGIMKDGKLTYVGHTGSGFDDKLLKEVSAKLEPLIQPNSPFEERVKTNQPVTWVQPKYVCELKFSEWTNDGKMRHPIFLRLREDKTIDDATTDDKKVEPVKEEPTEKKKASKKPSARKAKQPTPEPEKILESKQEDSKGEDPISKKAATKKAKQVAREPEEILESKQEDSNEDEPVKKKAAAKKTKEASQEEVSGVVDNEKEKTYKFGKAQVKTTNRTKVFFPEEGVTKGDVIDYYDRMADYILPYLKDRPESLFRTPNGIDKSGFFQKDAAEEAPDFVSRIRLYSDSANKDIDYIICNNKATLIYMANLGCIEINPWHSTTKKLDYPDYLIIDIDPSERNTFEHVIEAANVVKQILDKAGAASIPKISGATGLHVYVPTGKQYTYDQVKDFAYLICMLANEQLPEITTLERSLSKRSKDKIYMDYLQNRRGQTIACVYSLRPKKGATVSTPLDWSEVKPGLNPKDFNIHTIEQRLKDKGDLFGAVLKKPIDLLQCIQNLEG